MRTRLFLACVSTFALLGYCSNCHNCHCHTNHAATPVQAVRIKQWHGSPTLAIDVSEPEPAVVDELKPVPEVAEELVPKIKPYKQVRFSPDEPTFGHASDYSWLIGKIQRLQVNGGSWKIRYAPLDQLDRWGGSVVLSEDVRVEKFEDGELVYVDGEIIADRPTIYLTGPLYRITAIHKLNDKDRKHLWTQRIQQSTIRK